MAEKIKVAVVNEGMAGGIRKHILNIAQHLDRSRFELTIVFDVRKGYEAEGDPVSEFQQRGASCVIVPLVRDVSPLRDFRSFLTLRTLLRNFDIVHAHSAKAGFLTRSICRKNRKQACFYSPHNFSFQKFSGWKAWAYLQLERMAAPWGTAFILNSHAEEEVALRFGLSVPERIFVLPNAVSRPICAPNTRQRIRGLMGTPENRTVFIYVARLTSNKGYEQLLNAFSIGLTRGMEAELWIAGEGEKREALQQLSHELGLDHLVRFLGFQKNLLEFLVAADCFVLASQNEGSPYSILEALAVEKPIIATAVPGILDFLETNQHWKLLPWNDVSALSKAILDFFHSPFSGASVDALPPEWFDTAGQIRKLEDIYTRAATRLRYNL